jgi:5'(3')-deoxyribonucleotidase
MSTPSKIIEYHLPRIIDRPLNELDLKPSQLLILAAIDLHPSQPILIDMDNTTLDYVSKARKNLLDRYGTDIDLSKHRSHRLQDSFPEFKKEIHEVLSEPGFYKELPEFPYAREAILTMTALGLCPVFCTTSYRSNPTCIEDKLAYGRDLGIPVLVSDDKTKEAGSMLIEDDPSLVGKRLSVDLLVLYTQKSNIHCDSPRIDSWRDIIQVLRYL